MTLAASWAGAGPNIAPASVATLQAEGSSIVRAWKDLIAGSGATCFGSSNGGKATVNSVGAGTNFVIAFVSGTTWELTDNSGNSLFAADMVGSNLVLASFTNGGNNHTFVATAVPANNKIRFAQGGFTPVAETGPGAATWSVQAAAGLDGVDRWPADSCAIWAAGGVAHGWSWWQMVNPTGSFKCYIGICLSTGASNQHLVNLQCTTQAPTAGSVTADPTTVGANTRTWTNLQYMRTPVAAHHTHQVRSNRGDVCFAVSADSSGYPGFIFAYNRLVNGQSGVNYPCVAFANYQDSGVGGFQLLSGSQLAAFDQSGALFTTHTDLVHLHSNDANAHIANEFDGSAGSMTDPGTLPIFPIGVYGRSGTIAGFLGVMVDVTFAPNGANTGQGFQEPKSPALPERAKYSLGMFPCLGTSPAF